MLSTICLLPALLVLARASPVEIRQTDDLETFVAQQRNISLNGALANIGGLNSSLVIGADPGIVVASPSTVNPNYFYTWTRDSALTYMMLTDELIFGNGSLQKTIEDYTSAQAVLQTITNPSGSLWPAGLGLGEPKFYTNKTRFDQTWGRPQNDGPALRATAFMNIADAIFMRNPNASTIVTEVYWPLIINDLNYVGQYWNTTSYDLWEEVNGNSFFTTTAQHRSLVQGSLLAERINQTCAPCEQAAEILCFLQNNFWNETGNYITANINANQANRSQINVDPLLASMLAFDINATCDAATLQPCNSQVLATHKVVVDSFRNLYPINENATAPAAVAVGRYPEDVYYNGNPWYLTTLACAEVLYDAVAQIKQAGQVYVDEYSLPFFQDIYPSAQVAVYIDTALDEVTDAMTTYADGFVDVVRTYLPANGTINEQFNASTGEPTSAIALTWSFASFVTMAQRRSGQYPPSWGANSSLANTNLSTCAWSSHNSTFDYTPALAAGAPNVSMSTCLSEVLFEVNATTDFGFNIYIVGNTSILGGALGDASATIQPMKTGNITWYRPEWYLGTWLPAGSVIEYQYALQNQSAMTYTFENITRTVTTSPCGSGEMVTTDDAASFPS